VRAALDRRFPFHPLLWCTRQSSLSEVSSLSRDPGHPYFHIFLKSYLGVLLFSYFGTKQNYELRGSIIMNTNVFTARK
jgi:hypothetical protein